MTRKRIDALLTERYPHLSRNQVQAFIKKGLVSINGVTCTKPGTLVSEGDVVELVQDMPAYVSRAGEKLAAALDHFNIDVTGLVVLDVGISTGGFTDCLLQRGVARVYGVDVGHDQVHETIRHDPRVIVKEGVNIKELGALPEQCDMATIDVSFISVTKILPAVIAHLKHTSAIIILIKPQFEAGREHISRGGVVRDDKIHQTVIGRVQDAMQHNGYACRGVIDSPITGAKEQNKEFLGVFDRM